MAAPVLTRERIYERHNTPVSLVGLLRDSNMRSYLSGFADGEGCFCVSVNRSGRHRLGWEIRPSFSVSQNADRAEVLELFQKTLGCGLIRPDRSDKTLKFEVRSVPDLATKVLPHFERSPIVSSKRKDFEIFATIVRLMHDRRHLEAEGAASILHLASRLNAGGKKKFDRDAIRPKTNV